MSGITSWHRSSSRNLPIIIIEPGHSGQFPGTWHSGHHTPRARSNSTKKSKGKVPKRIQKAEREKMKREHVNELFLALADSLELTQQNNGKASTLGEATRLLKDLFSQIHSLKRENAALLSESQYVTIEKNELQDENSALEAQIGKLQHELEERVTQYKLDLNIAISDFHHPELNVEPTLQPSPVFVIPFHSGVKAYPESDSAELASQSTPNVSKPHARYPTQADSWASQLLGKEFQHSRGYISRFSGGD